MCKACQTPPRGYQVAVIKDVRQACRESLRDVPHWLAPLRSSRAELTYQLNRLARNAQFEDCEIEVECA
jgi:hypothetical protein